MTVLEFSREAETTYIYREREREIDFKELGHAIMEAPSPKSAE